MLFCIPAKSLMRCTRGHDVGHERADDNWVLNQIHAFLISMKVRQALGFSLIFLPSITSVAASFADSSY
jgi:hypothetical protein